MSFNVWTLIISIVAFVVSAGLTFYLKDYIQRRSNYGKVKKKLEQIAGKGAMVIYSPGTGVGMGPQPFKIAEFDREGVTLRNEIQSIFVPASKLIQSEWIVPSEKYEEAKLARVKQEMEGMMDAMFPAMFKKMMPAMKQALQEEMIDEKGGFAAVIGIRVQKALQEEGFEIKEIEGREKQG